MNQIKNKVSIEEKFYDYADTLTPYGVAVRYPNELFLEERHVKGALQYADEIFQWVTETVAEKVWNYDDDIIWWRTDLQGLWERH